MKKIFTKTSPNDLVDMLKARLQGKSFPIIAARFNKDHSTIVYWCKKFNVKPISFVNGEKKRKIILIRKDISSKRCRSMVPIKITLTVKRDFSIEKAKKYFLKDTLEENNQKDLYEDQRIIIPKDIPKEKRGDGIKTCFQCGKKKKNRKWIRTRYCSLICWFIYVHKGDRKRFY